jgi:hypothetical protein
MLSSSMEIPMPDSSKMVSCKAKVHTNGKMASIMKDKSAKIQLRDWED